MKKTIQAHAPRLITAVVLSLVMIVALSAAAYADAPQGGPQDGFGWDQQMGGPQGGLSGIGSMAGQEPPEMPEGDDIGMPPFSGESGFGGNGETNGQEPPEKPEGDESRMPPFGEESGFGGNGETDGQEPPEKPEGDEDRTPPADSENGFGGNRPMDRDGRDPMNRIITAVNELEDEEVRSDIESLMKAHLDAMKAERNAEDDEARAEAAQAVEAARDALNQALTDAGIDGMEAPADGQELPERPEGNGDSMPPADIGNRFDRNSGIGGRQQSEKPEGETQAEIPELSEDENGMYRLFQQFLEWMKGNSTEEK